MSKVTVIGNDFGELLASKLEAPFIGIEDRVFPDGEVQPRILGNVETEVAILTVRKKRNENINSYLIKVYLLAKKLSEENKKVVLVVPYLPYNRQDKVFRPGEPLSAVYIGELLKDLADYVVVVSPHEHRLNLSSILDKKAVKVSGFKALAHHFQEHDKFTVVAPDEEAERFVSEFCDVLNAKDVVYMKKHRDVNTGEVTLEVEDVTIGGSVILVDDIISTGSTIKKAVEALRRQGAESITVACVHGLFSMGSPEDFQKELGVEIICTNTVQNPFEIVDVTPFVAAKLKEVLS